MFFSTITSGHSIRLPLEQA